MTDSSARLTQLNLSLEKEMNALDALNNQKTDFERIQAKIDVNIQKNKELLMNIQNENEKVQESLTNLKKELEEHNKTFESHSKLSSTKVIRIANSYFNRSQK